MVRRGFSTKINAAFTATRPELASALPGWRVPDEIARERAGVNPFTGKVMVYKATRDPSPGSHASTPSSLPFEYVSLPQEEDWESEYLALDLALSNEDVDMPGWNTEELLVLIERRGLFEPALFGGRDNWVYSVPERMLSALCHTDDNAAMARILYEWNRRSPNLKKQLELQELHDLAVDAIGAGRSMFLWLDAPASRAK